MNEDRTPRRHVLKMLAGTLGGVGVMGCLGQGTSGTQNSGPLAAGNVADLTASSLTAIDGEGVAIGRDAGGLYAVSLICTHEQCDMSTRGSVSVNGIYCNCHGASFDRNGAATGGPANGPLEHYAVSVDVAGAITIDFDTVVDAATRTPAA